MSEGTQRRLAAIVSADVVGYSRLIGADEAGTLATLRAHRAEFIDPLIAGHGGRVVKTMGDGLLLEFPSVVGAVTCTLAVQAGMGERNADVPIDRRIVFRIGVNLGDVVIDGDDIHGDGVNVAARLQETCAPGGLALSGIAYESLGTLVDTAFEDGGPHEFKNIARLVQVWRWPPEGTDSAPDDAAPSTDLKLPGKPSIAVLPFENMSGDPEQEYFSDGITEDIITTLCQFNDLHVIARNSTLAYKGQAVDLRAVGQELGVRNVLEGSVRRAGDRVRITAQLVEAESGSHLWAERYDRPIDDIFEVQDEIAVLVAGAVNAELWDDKTERAARRGADRLAVWDLSAKAAWHLDLYYADDNRICQELSRQAISLDAGYAESYAILSNALNLAGLNGWSELPPAECYREAEHHARGAIERDRKFVLAHCYLSAALLLMGRSDDAVGAGEHAVHLCPGLSRAHLALGIALAWSGAEDSARAIEHLKTSIRLSPRDNGLVWTYTSLAAAEFMREGYDEAIRWARTGLQHNANMLIAHLVLTASLALSGDLQAAHLAFVNLDRAQPGITISATRDRVGDAFKRLPDLERYLDGLRKAGMPEE